MSNRIIISSLLSALTFFALSSQALASPTQVVDVDTPQCDPLSIPTNVDEIGHTTEFPADEALFPTNLGPTPFVPCVATNITTVPEVLIDIRNLTGKEWREVWYVADQETTITNFDGEANALGLPPLNEAFRIDNNASDPGGSHHPLVSESLTLDGIWEIGESWTFVLQDYSNTLGLLPEAITSIGVGSASSTPAPGLSESSGSIIAIPPSVPEPSALLLACLGLTGLFATGRR